MLQVRMVYNLMRDKALCTVVSFDILFLSLFNEIIKTAKIRKRLVCSI